MAYLTKHKNQVLETTRRDKIPNKELRTQKEIKKNSKGTSIKIIYNADDAEVLIFQ